MARVQAPQPPSLPPEPTADPGASAAAERQRRYRAKKALGSLDAPRAILQRLEGLRSRTGLTNDQLLAQALDLLEAQLTQPPRKASRRPSQPAAGLRTPPSAAESPASSSKQPSPGDVLTNPVAAQLDLLGGPIQLPGKRHRAR
jgi:hypothetical protein